MKIKSLVLVIILFVGTLAFSGCKNKNISSINLNQPDKINMYVSGKQKQLTRNGSDHDKAIFDRINVLVNIRIPEELSAMKGEISDNDIKEFKGYAVEFVYKNVQTVVIDNKKVQFTEVVFPLSEKWQNTAFIKAKDNFYTGVGLKENLDSLVKASVK
ncbi:hypothetical protein [Clostridium sp. JN-9]|uniref:hypothetical protein n=1 Tax=Clostridium sp. JN-9 TaxID=2507159 RepID=UPI000FFE02B2|nr:hypothetical protein [Clostridium sp. JN-9]QAT40952.1 hypothetical protein EQM05_12155 [Clostridium sp. JN-9]